MNKVFPPRPWSFDVALSSQIKSSQFDTTFYWRVVVPLEQNSNLQPISNRKGFSKILKVDRESAKPIFEWISSLKYWFLEFTLLVFQIPWVPVRDYEHLTGVFHAERDVCQVPAVLMTSFLLLTPIAKTEIQFWIFQSPPFSNESLAYAHALFRLSASNSGHLDSLLFFRKYICLP